MHTGVKIGSSTNAIGQTRWLPVKDWNHSLVSHDHNANSKWMTEVNTQTLGYSESDRKMVSTSEFVGTGRGFLHRTSVAQASRPSSDKWDHTIWTVKDTAL